MNSRADRGAAVLTGVALPERYEPIRRIARGGMATVWCAQDRTLDRQVAIKLLAEPYADDELAGRRFKREARAAARLSGHPNVVTIYDVGEAPVEEGSRGRPFLVMEHLSGGTVADALRAGIVNPTLALTWLQQAAAALDYAHRRGVIHRDVKPANFLLDREQVLHVADFGIAQLGSEDTLTVSGEVLGTAAYLAPERALGQPATEASDRYGLAVVAYELLVGERPFKAEHFAAQARQHVEDPPPVASHHNPELPSALDGILVRGMAKGPEERFGSALELTDAIEAALGSGARRPVAGEPTTRRMPAAALGASAAGLGAARAPIAARAQNGAARAPSAANGRSRQRPARALLEPEAQRPAGHGPGRSRLAVLGALAAVLLAVAIAAALSGGPSPTKAAGSRHALAASRGASPPRHSTKTTATHAPASPAAPVTSSTSPAATSSPVTPTHAASPPPATGGAVGLETQGHSLMDSGNYQAAIPVLERAVAAAGGPNDITYAYALYDLGHSLRLAGNPRAAVPILLKRLQIPNQTATVRNELSLALQALGRQASPPPGAGNAGPQGGGQPQGGGGGD